MVVDSGNPVADVRETPGARRRWWGSHRLQLLVAAVAAGCYSALLARTLPITFDEAHNWMAVSRRGVDYATHHYPAANNHMLFTALQALVPASLVRSDPLNLRLINIAVAIALMTLMFRWLVRDGVPSPVALVGLLLGGPLTVLYLGVARGYLLGTLLAFLGLHLLAAERRRTQAALGAGVLLALAVYSVPTFALGVLGVVILLGWHRRWVDAVVFGASAGILALVLYLPVLHQVVRAGEGHPVTGAPRHYAGRFAPGVYTFNVLRDSLYVTAFGPDILWAGVVCAAAAGLAFLAYRRRTAVRVWLGGFAPGPRETTVFALVAAYSVAALAIIEVAIATRITSAPFYRNALFVAFAVVLWLLRQLRTDGGGGRLQRTLFAALVAANVVAAGIGVSLLVTGRDYSTSRYGDVLLATPPPELRDVAALGATSVVCSEKDMPACNIYTPYLADRGVRVFRTGWTTHRHRCLTGHELPIRPHGVLAYRGRHVLGLLCQK
jgi:hypothetical protein